VVSAPEGRASFRMAISLQQVPPAGYSSGVRPTPGEFAGDAAGENLGPRRDGRGRQCVECYASSRNNRVSAWTPSCFNPAAPSSDSRIFWNAAISGMSRSTPTRLEP
jgi:hypothetical protein